MVNNTSIRRFKSNQIFTRDLSELGGAIVRDTENTYRRKSSFCFSHPKVQYSQHN